MEGKYQISDFKKKKTNQLHSLKLTASLHLKIDGWKTMRSFWDPAYFQGQTVSFRECKFSARVVWVFIFEKTPIAVASKDPLSLPHRSGTRRQHPPRLWLGWVYPPVLLLLSLRLCTGHRW